jgi:hypothetical protein
MKTIRDILGKKKTFLQQWVRRRSFAGKKVVLATYISEGDDGFCFQNRDEDSVFKTVDCWSSSSSSLIILGNAHLVSFSRLGPILVKVFWSKNLLHNDQTKGIFLIFFAKRQKWFHWFFDQTTWTKIGLSLVTY